MSRARSNSIFGPASVSDIPNTSTGALDVPSGNLAQRPATPTSGNFRFNQDSNRFEGYSTGWNEFASVLGTATNPATDATALSDNGITASGWYYLKGTGGSVYQVYCDFNMLGGKWMLLHQFNNGINFGEGADLFTTVWNPGNSNSGATDATQFILPVSKFSKNGIGSDLALFARVYSAGQWRRFGAVWKGVPLNPYWQENYPADGAGCNTTACSAYVSGDGVNWSAVPSPLTKCEGWNGPVYCKETSTYSYQDSSLSTGGMIFHSNGPDLSITQLYGALEGVGLVSSYTPWSYGQIWARVL